MPLANLGVIYVTKNKYPTKGVFGELDYSRPNSLFV